MTQKPLANKQIKSCQNIYIYYPYKSTHQAAIKLRLNDTNQKSLSSQPPSSWFRTRLGSVPTCEITGTIAHYLSFHLQLTHTPFTYQACTYIFMYLSHIHHNRFWRVKAIQFAIHFLDTDTCTHTHTATQFAIHFSEIQTHAHTLTQSNQENVTHKHMKVSGTYTNIYWYECYILLVSGKILISTLELSVKDYPDMRPSLLSGHFFWYLPFDSLMPMNPWPHDQEPSLLQDSFCLILRAVLKFRFHWKQTPDDLQSIWENTTYCLPCTVSTDSDWFFDGKTSLKWGQGKIKNKCHVSSQYGKRPLSSPVNAASVENSTTCFMRCMYWTTTLSLNLVRFQLPKTHNSQFLQLFDKAVTLKCGQSH